MWKFIAGFACGILVWIGFIHFNKSSDSHSMMRATHTKSVELVVGLSDKGPPQMAYLGGNYTITFMREDEYQEFCDKLHKLVQDR